jgi:hypothetical protein
MDRRILAREWLVFFGCFAGTGALYLYILLVQPYGPVNTDRMLSSYLPVSAFLYATIQVIRVTVWSLGNVTSKKSH